jgi:hypothetical protein
MHPRSFSGEGQELHVSKPNPTELFAHMRFLSSVTKHRNLYCAHYDRCLDQAVKQGWEGWSCLNCPLFRVEGQKPDVRDFAINGRRE